LDQATHHAEIGAVLGLGREITTGSSVYVARTNKVNEPRLSKPCDMCLATLKFVGVGKVFYTLNEPGEYEVIKL
jgi:tRNA(Arg) A34 adenosine deaminase TadA